MTTTKTIRKNLTKDYSGNNSEANLVKLEETWGEKYGAAVRSWQNNWEELAAFFEFPKEIRRLIYTTNSVEGYHRQVRKVIKNTSSFPTPQAARKLLYLATMGTTKKWKIPIRNWPLILKQLAVRFEYRWPE